MELNIVVWVIGVISGSAALFTVVVGLIPEPPAERDPMELDQDEWSHYQVYGERK